MMRRTLAALAALGLAASLAAPIFAQDIMGMSMRPAPGSKDLAGTGLIDITRGEKAGSYMVNVDMAKATESLDLSKFSGAKSFVVWAVDKDGMRHNLGTLDDKKALAKLSVDYTVAKVYVTAETDGKATSPSTPLYSVTLRQVKEQESAPATADSKAAAAGAATATTDSKSAAPTAAMATTASASAATSPTAAAKTDAKPNTLPTTGTGATDLAVMALLALLFVGAGLKLSGTRA